MEQLGLVLLLLTPRAVPCWGAGVFNHNERVGQKHSSFKDKGSTVQPGERPGSLLLPVACGDTHLRARLTCSGFEPWQRLSPGEVSIEQEARMFIFLPKQTLCPSVSTHAIY